MGPAFGSVCSGIEAASVAWGPLGYRCAFMSEIARFPRAVLSHRFPDVPLRDDYAKPPRGDAAAHRGSARRVPDADIPF